MWNLKHSSCGSQGVLICSRQLAVPERGAVYGARKAVMCSVSTLKQRPTEAGTNGSPRPQYTSLDSPPGRPFGAVAHELVRGALVRYSADSTVATAPTAVLLHGVLGSRRNMQSYARMIVEGFPSWQVLLVDLRCHGETANLPDRGSGPHTVDAAADDVLALLRRLKIFPHTLIGHSFGGKVAMSMVKQFGQRMPRPVQVWVLDALPGNVRTGEANGRDHPKQLIKLLRSLPTPVPSRNSVADILADAGFSLHIARWASTNLRPVPSNNGVRSAGMEWGFDLDGIAELYRVDGYNTKVGLRSYEDTCLWPLLENPPQGLKLDFVRAERSTFRWGGDDQDRIEAAGHCVHLLANSGHWVHTDNPMGLFDIMGPSFGKVDLHLQRSSTVGQR